MFTGQQGHLPYCLSRSWDGLGGSGLPGCRRPCERKSGLGSMRLVQIDVETPGQILTLALAQSHGGSGPGDEPFVGASL
ncbi:MAG TPA: hypothetical protein DHW65_09830 [Dehalococcoidia bacterium]|nr:hypothetical protein [Dehalococcoidia bacterium]